MKVIDGLDDAFIGVARRCGQPDLAVYSKSIAIKLLQEDIKDHAEAQEYFDFNIEGAWVGDDTPLIFYEMTLKEYQETLRVIDMSMDEEDGRFKKDAVEES